MNIGNHFKEEKGVKYNLKLNNRGSSIIMVLVAMAFVGILGAVILSTTVTNVQMKMVDRKEKSNFYTTENILDIIKEGLQRDAGNALSESYLSVMQNFSSFPDKTARETKFQELYLDKLINILKSTNANEYSIDILRGYLEEDIHKAAVSSSDPKWSYSVAQGLTLKNIEIIYTNSENYTSGIKTDIQIDIPVVEFTEEASIPDILDYSIIATNGLNFNNTYAYIHNVKGNIFSGKDIIVTGSGTDVTFSNGQKLIAADNLIVKNQAKVSASNNSVWAKNIEVEAADLTLKSETKVANDLKLSGSGSNVILKNSYSGFGSSDVDSNSRIAEEAKNSFKGSKSKTSSAILINGMNTLLNIDELNHFLIAGNSYIFTEGNTQDSSNLVMGESVTVISNQIAYLIPGDLIGDGHKDGGKNPLTESEERAITQNQDIVNITKEHSRFGNKSIQQLGADYKKIYRTNFNLEEPMVYYYLLFNDVNKANEFFNIYYNIPENKEIFKYYSQLYNNIIHTNNSAGTSFVMNGNMSYYNGNDLNTIKNTSMTDSDKANLKSKQADFYNQFYTLCKNLTDDYNKLSGVEKNTSLFENLVDVNAFSDVINSGGQEVRFEGSDGTYAMAVNKDTFIIDGNHTGLKFLIAKGDVVVNSNFTGIIIADGTVEVRGGAATVSSDPIGASKLLTSRNSNRVQFGNMLKNTMGVGSGTPGGTGKDSIQLFDLVSYKNWKKQ